MGAISGLIEVVLICSSQNSQKSVTIIGAGVAGMSAASVLAEAGFHVHLIESLLLSEEMDL
jgi:heterodisulfide reductase subunit A-like polyferredoxin